MQQVVGKEREKYRLSIKEEGPGDVLSCLAALELERRNVTHARIRETNRIPIGEKLERDPGENRSEGKRSPNLKFEVTNCIDNAFGKF